MANRVFEDEFMDIQTEMVQIGLDFEEKVSGDVQKIYLLIFYQGNSFSASVFFKVGNQILEWQDMQIEGGYDTYINVFFQKEYEQSKQLQELFRANGRPCPEELRLTYDLETEEFDAEYGYDVPEGILIDDLCNVWVDELRAKLVNNQPRADAVEPQFRESAKPEQAKKSGFKFPFFWKK